MSTSRTRPFPAWDPNRLAKIARASGQSVHELRAEIRDRARIAAQPGHLDFETLQRGEFTPDEVQHLDTCSFCQTLHEAVSETLTADTVERWIFGAAEPATTPSGGSAGQAPEGENLHRMTPFGWRIAAGVAAVLAVGTLAFLIGRHRNEVESRQLAAALTIETQFSVAKDLVAAGEYPRANSVLLTAFARSGMDDPTLNSVSRVLRTTPATDKAAAENARQKIGHLIQDIAAKNEHTQKREPEPRDVLELSGLQMKSGETRASYQTLATYLKSVDGQTAAVSAYENRFVNELPRAN